MRLGDLDALKKTIDDYAEKRQDILLWQADIEELIDNAPTVEIPVARWDCYCEGQKVGYEKALSERPQGVCKDCDNCEDKALSYSMGFQDGYLLGGFQLTELRRWLTSQGYSEGTVDDKINEFTRFVEKIRGEE